MGCEEVITTQCTQTSQTASTHTAVVDQSTRLVETGLPAPVDPHVGANYVAPAGTVIGSSGGPLLGDGVVSAGYSGLGVGVGGIATGAVGATGLIGTTGAIGTTGFIGTTGVVGTTGAVGTTGLIGGYRKREAEAEASIGGGVVGVPVAHSGPSRSINAPVCSSTPVKNCHKTPVSRPRKVARVVCDTIVDVTTIEDCVETVTKQCTSSSTAQHAHSAVVGHDSQVVSSGEQQGVVGHAVGPAVAGASFSAGSAIGATAVGVGHGIGIGAGVAAVGATYGAGY